MNSVGFKRCALVFLLALFGSCSNPLEGPNTDGSKIREIEQIWTTLPIYPGMTEVDQSRNSSGTQAHLSKGFRSTASLSQVRQFYIEKLVPQGWVLVEDRKMDDWGRDLGGYYLAFRKSNFKLSIQYSGQKKTYGWDYGIGVYWGGY